MLAVYTSVFYDQFGLLDIVVGTHLCKSKMLIKSFIAGWMPNTGRAWND